MPALTPAVRPAAQTPPTDPLAGLRDIHLPDPVSTLPAYGWWLLAGLLLALLLAAVLLWWQQRRRTAYRRQALQLLSQIASDQPAEVQLQQLNQLLKRTALSVYPPERVSALHGQQWSDFLQRTLGTKTCAGSQCFGADLYRPGDHSDAALGRRFAQYWIRHHQRRLRPAVATSVADTQGAAHA